jgi:hypothetical protein
LQRQLIQLEVPYRCRNGSTSKTSTEKPVVKKGSGKVVADKKEVKAVIETRSRLKSQ